MALRLTGLTVGPFAANCYVIGRGEDLCVVIDPGAEAPRILEAVGGRRVAAILLTHGHADHIGALEEVRRATGTEVWCPEADAAYLEDPNLNLSALFGAPFTVRPAEHLYRDGEAIGAPPVVFRAIHTPGHTPGSSCLYLEEDRILASGDTLFAGSIGRTDFPGGDAPTLLRSIRERLFTLADDIAVQPGHGPATRIGTERRFNPFLR